MDGWMARGGRGVYVVDFVSETAAAQPGCNVLCARMEIPKER